MILIPTTHSGKPIKPLGVLWYKKEEDHQKMKEICLDLHDADYDTWLMAAITALDDGTLAKFRTKVEVDPDKFALWCSQKRLSLDASSRQRYVYELVEGRFEQELKNWKLAKKSRLGKTTA